MSFATSSVCSPASLEFSAPMASRAHARPLDASSTMTFAPACAAVVAATMPPLPAPTTTTSASKVSATCCGTAGFSHQSGFPAAFWRSRSSFVATAGAPQPVSAPAAARALAAPKPVRKLRRLNVLLLIWLLLFRVRPGWEAVSPLGRRSSPRGPACRRGTACR